MGTRLSYRARHESRWAARGNPPELQTPMTNGPKIPPPTGGHPEHTHGGAGGTVLWNHESFRTPPGRISLPRCTHPSLRTNGPSLPLPARWYKKLRPDARRFYLTEKTTTVPVKVPQLFKDPPDLRVQNISPMPMRAPRIHVWQGRRKLPVPFSFLQPFFISTFLRVTLFPDWRMNF